MFYGLLLPWRILTGSSCRWASVLLSRFVAGKDLLAGGKHFMCTSSGSSHRWGFLGWFFFSPWWLMRGCKYMLNFAPRKGPIHAMRASRRKQKSQNCGVGGGNSGVSWLPTTRPGCPEPCPALPWMPPGMGHPQLLWTTCSSVSPPSESAEGKWVPGAIKESSSLASAAPPSSGTDSHEMHSRLMVSHSFLGVTLF